MECWRLCWNPGGDRRRVGVAVGRMVRSNSNKKRNTSNFELGATTGKHARTHGLWRERCIRMAAGSSRAPGRGRPPGQAEICWRLPADGDGRAGVGDASR